ncbi:MAG: SMC family ATPase [Acidobacteria bacterium]|nr:SMC family ATPase [Acidobacteriota bacterium]
MHVTRVELINIKSHINSEFHFGRGTTAITGENGAGKTTILEAIAWSLFDTLDYSKEDFLRRGAKKGSVRVTFESDLDERQYTVYRDTGTGYYVFDHGLSMRVAEKKKDVSDFLHLHLGIEPGTDLKALFRSAIGVPQGSFTAEFMLAPNARKAAFDRLLKVEEYRDGADRLRDTVRLIEERTTEVRERIGRAEGQLERYDELTREHAEVAGRAGELEAALSVLKEEIAERAGQVALMDAAEGRVNEARTLRSRLEVEQEGALRRLGERRAERDVASAAAGRRAAVEGDYRAHAGALESLSALESERAARDRVRAEATRVEGLKAAAGADLKRLEEALQRAVQATASAVELAPLILEQEELERERERLRDLRAQAISAGQRLAQMDEELVALRKQHAQIKERFKEAEKGAGAQQRAQDLQSERLDLETRLSTAEKAATSLRHLTSQKKETAREVERLRREVLAREQEARDLERFAAQAEAAASLIARERELTEQLAQLKAEITRDEKFRREVKNGLCPILSEKCLNIGEGQTLEDYFKDQFASNTTQLGALEEESAGVRVAVREAREAEKHFSRLESTRAQLITARELLAEREAVIERLDKELHGLPPADREHLNRLQAQLSGLDGELIVVQEAALRYAEMKPLQQRLQEIEREGKAKRDARESVAAAAAAVTALDKDIQENEKRLRALEDPRTRAAALRAEAERAPALKSEIAGATDALHALETQANTLSAQLAEYEKLEEQWNEARATRDRTHAGHREYLAVEATAATLPARESELKQAEAEAARAASAAERARAEHDAAVAAYVRERHDEERARLLDARTREAAHAAQLEAAQGRADALGVELERLTLIRDSMRDEFRAKEKLEELNETTEFIRDTLKQAGPLVTESYLYNISIEANQLFREITGEAGRALRWSRDYEIVLEEEGHDRSFQNLSGGEQMAAALSVRLALLKQLSDIRLAFFDEPTVNMDAERRERLAQQIGQVRHFDQLFVISHDDTFAENVDHTIHVKRSEHRAEALVEG